MSIAHVVSGAASDAFAGLVLQAERRFESLVNATGGSYFRTAKPADLRLVREPLDEAIALAPAGAARDQLASASAYLGEASTLAAARRSLGDTVYWARQDLRSALDELGMRWMV